MEFVTCVVVAGVPRFAISELLSVGSVKAGALGALGKSGNGVMTGVKVGVSSNTQLSVVHCPSPIKPIEFIGTVAGTFILMPLSSIQTI
jgi:hypothetical protein